MFVISHDIDESLNTLKLNIVVFVRLLGLPFFLLKPRQHVISLVNNVRYCRKKRQPCFGVCRHLKALGRQI